MSLGEKSIPKKTWVAPKIVLLPAPNVENNASGGGDGDAALAHS